MGNLMMDRARLEVWEGTNPLQLSQSEFDILWMLASRPGRIYSPEEIQHGISKPFSQKGLDRIHQFVYNLKEKMASKHIQWVAERGYRLT